MTDASARTNWLTLGAAADRLGVSESTVRRWADGGDIRSYRTSGGHRRVAEDDLERMVTAAAVPARTSEHISDVALARVRRRLSRGRERPYVQLFETFGVPDRERLRLLGRQMVDLFARYIASDTKGERFTEDARTIGHEYGRTLVGAGVRLTAAVVTFNTLRITLEQTAAQIAAEAGLSTEDAVDAIERVLRLADVVLEGMAEVYEGPSPA